MKHVLTLAMAALMASGCTKAVDQCMSNSDCKDPAYPFCDVNGEFPESGGNKNVCTIVPPECPVEQCGCEAGATTCSSNQLSICNQDGKSVTMTECSLGCEDDGTACKTFTPSNGLGPALVASATDQPMTIPSGATIDTDSGAVMGSDGTEISVASTLISQGAYQVRVFAAAAFVIGDVTISGADPLAFVAAGSIALNGKIDLGAHVDVPGAGSQTKQAPCFGAQSEADSCVNSYCGFGAGGGGNSTAGGAGGGFHVAGGTGGDAITEFMPLVGGCSGGAIDYVDSSGSAITSGGPGGGAIQIVSSTKPTARLS